MMLRFLASCPQLSSLQTHGKQSVKDHAFGISAYTPALTAYRGALAMRIPCTVAVWQQTDGTHTKASRSEIGGGSAHE